MKINHADRGALFSRLFGNNIQRAREAVAACLIRWRIHPDMLTVCGLLATLAAAPFLALGAGDYIGSSTTAGHSWHPLIAALLIILAAAFDILDGAVARNSGECTKRGAFLDSCCDRIADAGIFAGIAFYFITHNEIAHHAWFALAAIVALGNAEMISYVKARAEDFVEQGGVGYWQRGERIAAVFIGLFCGHIATVMVQLAISSAFTVLRRLTFNYAQIRRLENALPLIDPRAALTGWARWQLWRYRRMSVPYDIVTATNIAIILFVDLQRW